MGFAIHAGKTRLFLVMVYAKIAIKCECKPYRNVWKAAQKDLMNIGRWKIALSLEKCQAKREMITISQFHDLRRMITELTRRCMLTEDEYREFCVLINKVLNRMEEDENERSKMD